MATTTLHGIPQLALPYHFDQPILGRQLANHGAGLTISSAETTGQSVRDNLLRLLGEPAFRSRAEDLRDEMFAMPTPNHLIPRLEELTEKHRTS
jgi:UDP:flavonoid glycosyltransferase YjiC (YdhE family)